MRFGRFASAETVFTVIEMPPVIPSVGGFGDDEDTGGGGGGKKGGTVAILPVDMTGQIGISPSTDISGGGGGGFGVIDGNVAFLDGLTGGTSVAITVNTVSADANLPNLIVDALQQYNLVSGPIDVTIAA